ncbi:FecCD family ABC transporter permease [Salirhabdus salicampi]|uniref:FecCD family ABC transporter permease n=1 Tax=Salirhabdus salicampi TaxID=476102 RepID=UPI0020C4FA94|nr:iron chelate uptake ABC transporter family permease subunit [Salirhabdus salicampi]MCP8615306.1 iron chelate uptake ABC transporter family permease subunit [Salirhabdus salicampi]
MSKHKKPLLLLAILFIVTLFTFIITAGIGTVFISPITVIQSLIGLDIQYGAILEKYRFPRAVLALLVGAGLGVSGAILQGVIRNPLASPDVIGITKGAGLAAVITIILFPQSPTFALPLAAFLGAGLVTVFLYLIAYKKGVKPSTLALVGIALGAVCQAGIQFFMVKYPVEVNAALVWLTGSLWGNNWNDVYLLLPFVIVFVPISIIVAVKLDVLALGDEVAQGLGEHVRVTRMMLLFIAVALAGASVAVVGSLGFIGLIAPHIARQLVGNRHQYLLPTSAFTGMILVLIADALGRGIAPPVEVPAGIFTAVIGAPYFLYLLRKLNAN